MLRFLFLSLLLLLSACSSLGIHRGEPALQLAVPHVKQLYPESCGIAALSSVTAFWGDQLDQALLYREYPPQSADGYSVGELKRLAQAQGFHAFGLEADVDFLERQLAQGRPLMVALSVDARYLSRLMSGPLTGLVLAVLSPQYDHFVVVTGLGREEVLLMDPILGQRSVTRRRFEAMWGARHHAALLVAH